MSLAFLIVERGHNAGMRIELKDFPATLGRDPNNTVVIRDSESSRHHIRIKQRGRLYILEDLESRNGTYINGDRVINSTLTSGDKILVGSTELLFIAPDSNIQISSNIDKFDMHMDEGLKVPIDLENPHRHHFKRAIRLDPVALANNMMSNGQAINDIFNYHSNLIVIKDLKETCHALLKSLGKIVTNSSRAAIFIWSNQARQLLPYASKEFNKSDKSGFLLSRSAFEDALSRRQGILLTPEVKATQQGRNRVILPVCHAEEIVALVHIEIDSPREEFAMHELECAQALLQRASPLLEAMLLRQELDGWLGGVIETMLSVIEAKDTYTRGHSERVSSYCMAVADELRLQPDVKRLLMISALCHDVGKIGIPDAILKKASLLSSEEYQEMKLHPTIGANIIAHLPNAPKILSGVRYHHEKWDGTGYEGLAGEDIPFFGRIVALADVYDAMVSGRSYSGFMDQQEAVTRLQEEAELFDPEILKAFVRACEKGTLSLKTSTQNNEPEVSETDTEITKFK
ncbi:MAG: HD domain-containing protein [Proteobacteria bacterium]|nr:MAG: HD domain-containing protein [Pseudomonadota bacterium]